MKKVNEIISREVELVEDNSGDLHKTDSIFMGINIAGLRCKQLRLGARSRLAANSAKHKNTVVAVEEVKQGLIAFRFVEDPLA